MTSSSKKSLRTSCVETTLTSHTFVCLASARRLAGVSRPYTLLFLVKGGHGDLVLETPLACCWAS